MLGASAAILKRGCAAKSASTHADRFIDVREVDRNTLEPILFLLQSPDIEVQRAASAALGNLAVNSMLHTLVYDQAIKYLICYSGKQGTYRTAWWSHTPHPPNDVAKCRSTVQCGWLHHEPGNTRRQQSKNS
jgi:vacuolar protein 8